MPTPVTQLDASRHETTHRYPWFLPDGRHFLYMAANLSGAPDDPANLIRVGTHRPEGRPGACSRPTRTRSTRLPPPDSSEGHLLFPRDGTLFAQRFDPKRLQTGGDADSPIAQHVASTRSSGDWRFSARREWDDGLRSSTTPPRPFPGSTGTAGRSAPSESPSSFFPESRAERQGCESPRTGGGSPRPSSIPRPKPRTSGSTISSAELRTRLTTRAGQQRPTDLVPGREVHHLRVRPEAPGRSLPEAARRRRRRAAPRGRRNAGPGRLVSRRAIPGPRGPGARGRAASRPFDPLPGRRKADDLLPPRVNIGEARFSPDGRWLAYTSEESGRNEIYVAAFPGPGDRWQVSTGRRIPTRAGGGRQGALLPLLGPAIDVGRDPHLGRERPSPASPKLLFEPHPLPTFFDAAADGQRFLFISSGVEQSPPITLVQNWAAGIKK